MAENPFLWSITASDNDDADASVPWPEGMSPSAVNNGARAIMAGVARLIADMNGTITTGGSSNAYTVTANCPHSTYTNGIYVAAKASFTNTGAATLNLNAIGAKKIRQFINGSEAALGAGQIISGSSYQFRYDSALDSANGAFLLLNPSPDPTLIITSGTIKLWPSDTLETGWLWCNGDAQLIANYPNLFAKISNLYGGDGVTTFAVPDYRGRAPFGSDDMNAALPANRITNAECGIVGTTLGAGGGAQSVALSTSQIAAHTHDGSTAGQSSDHTHSGTTSSNGAHQHNVSGGTIGGTGFTPTGAGGGALDYVGDHANIVIDSAGAHTHTMTTGTTSSDHAHAFTTNSTGGGATHNNMPPALIQNFVIKT